MGRGVFTGPKRGMRRMELSHRLSERPSTLMFTMALDRQNQKKQIRGSC